MINAFLNQFVIHTYYVKLRFKIIKFFLNKDASLEY